MILGTEVVKVQERIVVGLQTRTTNREEFASGGKGKIAQLWQKFFQDNCATTIPNQVDHAPTISVMTDYESDYMGAYTLIIGKEVNSTQQVPSAMASVTIKPGTYLRFSAQGTMPAVVIETWQFIWDYFAKSHQYKRLYSTDFEVYPADKPGYVEVYIAVQEDPR
jgi:predicted transcriptional regulator YdeE